MKKTFKFLILALFTSFASLGFAQENGVNLDELVAAVRENPEAVAELVEEAVSASPGQILDITDRLMATFPELTEEIIFGALAGLPQPLEEEDVRQLLMHATLYRPGLAPDIVRGARRATTPAMEPIIGSAVSIALETAISERGLGVIGRTDQSSESQESYNPNIRIISPSEG